MFVYQGHHLGTIEHTSADLTIIVLYKDTLSHSFLLFPSFFLLFVHLSIFLLPLSPLSNKVERIEVLYWKVSNPDLFSPSQFPCFIGFKGDHEDEFYGLPVDEYPGLFKVIPDNTRTILIPRPF